jgi:hypothetical protein
VAGMDEPLISFMFLASWGLSVIIGTHLTHILLWMDANSISYDRFMPCPSYSLCEEELLIEKNGNIVDIICEELSLPPL